MEFQIVSDARRRRHHVEWASIADVLDHQECVTILIQGMTAAQRSNVRLTGRRVLTERLGYPVAIERIDDGEGIVFVAHRAGGPLDEYLDAFREERPDARLLGQTEKASMSSQDAMQRVEGQVSEVIWI